MNKSIKAILTDDTYQVTTTAGEVFSVAESARMYAMIYKRFGRNVEATANAVARMLQSSPAPTQTIACLIATGLALFEEDNYGYNADACYATQDEMFNVLQGYFDDNLEDVMMRLAFPVIE